eukprot:8525638-Pyramimonas_sp.AAC.1
MARVCERRRHVGSVHCPVGVATRAAPPAAAHLHAVQRGAAVEAARHRGPSRAAVERLRYLAFRADHPSVAGARKAAGGRCGD